MASTAKLQVSIISPEKPLYSGDALSVVATAHDGDLGILPDHAPMVAALGVGEVRVTKGTLSGQTVDRFAVRGGFVHTSQSEVRIVTEAACAAKDIDGRALERAIATTEAELAQAGANRGELQDRLVWYRAQQKVAAKPA